MMMMTCSGQTSAIALLLALFVACQLQVDGLGLDTIKSMTSTVAQNAAKKADETPEVEQTGGVRATIAHTGISLAAEKAIDVLGHKYPAMKLLAPLAKPLINKAHKTINNMSANRNKEADESKEESGAEEKADEEEPKKEGGGLLNKIKSAVGANYDTKKKGANETQEEPKKNEDSEEKKPEEKVEAKKEDEGEKKADEEEPKKEGGLLSKIKSAVGTGDKKEKEAEEQETGEEPKEGAEEKVEGEPKKERARKKHLS